MFIKDLLAIWLYIHALPQDCSALVTELLQSCTEPSKKSVIYQKYVDENFSSSDCISITFFFEFDGYMYFTKNLIIRNVWNGQ